MSYTEDLSLSLSGGKSYINLTQTITIPQEQVIIVRKYSSIHWQIRSTEQQTTIKDST